MTQHRDIERLLDHWLEIGPTEAADRVVDAVTDRIDRQSQRPAWRLDWRHRLMNPLPRAALAAAVAIVVVATGFIVIRSSTDPAAIGAPTPSPVFSAALVTTPSPGQASPVPREAGTVDEGPTLPPPPTFPPPHTVRSGLRVPMAYTMSPGWTLYADTPTEVRLGFHPLTHTNTEEGDADPDVSIGIPYGFDSVGALLHFFKTSPTREWCPYMASPRRVTFGELSGHEFNCWTEHNGDQAIYPRTRKGALDGIKSASRESDDWYVYPKGGPFIDFFVPDVKGSPTIIAITGDWGWNGTGRRGPGPIDSKGLTLAPLTQGELESLRLDFTP